LKVKKAYANQAREEGMAWKRMNVITPIINHEIFLDLKQELN
jgi:hypothetical protein